MACHRDGIGIGRCEDRQIDHPRTRVGDGDFPSLMIHGSNHSGGKMRDKISMVHGRKAPQAKGRRDANRESEQLQKRTPIRETNVQRRAKHSQRAKSKEKRTQRPVIKTSLIFSGLHERAALPEKLPGDAKDETRRDCKRERAERKHFRKRFELNRAY